MQNWDATFFLNSILLGAGLAMDAFSVSMTHGLTRPNLTRGKHCLIAGVFAFFQFIMPLVGWFCVHTIVNAFSKVQKFIPWIALFLLLFIGGKMLIESIFKKEKQDEENNPLSFKLLFVQGIATSIDALSVGFTIDEYGFVMAFVACVIIAVVTFLFCYFGIIIGKKIGTKLADKAGILGGIILIGIGIEIFVKGLFF
ncbi:MAG: manganese efflux pump [Treponema sp.]|nr:manganese efflux pump [Treponema sp.]